MYFNYVLLHIIAFIISNRVDAAVFRTNDLRLSKERLLADLSGCTLFEQQCSHLDESLSLLSCALDTAHNNKTQISFHCQHKIWTYQAELLDNTFLDYQIKDRCHEETNILDCFNSTIKKIDCILKRKPSVRDKKCWWVISKVESVIFNDWQITDNFLKNCMDDIEAHKCGRVPTDSKVLSQAFTLRCLQGKEEKIRPECQSEINALKEMKYSSLQLDKIVLAACNVDQSNYCPDELPGSLLMYKCLVRHKYERGILFYVLYIICILTVRLIKALTLQASVVN